MSYNKVILTGNLTRDPEVRVTPTGLSVCKCGIASSRKYGDKETTVFVDLTIFGKQGETFADHMQKGRQVLIDGRLDMEQWQDQKTGENRSKLGVIVENFTFLGSSGKVHTSEQRATGSRPPASNNDIDDDVPF